MSKAFIAEIIQNSAEITGVAANRAAADLIEAIVKDPRTGESIKVKAGKTVRFKASPSLKATV